MTSVPFNDLYLQYQNIQMEIDQAIATVIRDSAFIRGPHVTDFEATFAKLFDREHCISCSEGTAAIYIAMYALGVKPGDEVIVPAMSWISTSETVTQAGGTVRFCEIDAETHTMDPDSLASLINPNTVGIIPVHLYGHPAPMIEIMSIAKKHGLWVIEDCAQAHLATIDGKKVGTFGEVGTFSFYPGKNLGAMGDAGAIVTNDAALARKMAMFARHGGIKKGDHEIEGINSRLDGMQAAILNVKLPYLAGWTNRRRELASKYIDNLSGTSRLKLPTTCPGTNPVWHLFVVLTDERDQLAMFLKKNEIQTVINYPRSLPFLPCYEHFHHMKEDFPNSARLQEQCLSLPIYPEMTDAQLGLVCQSVAEFFN